MRCLLLVVLLLMSCGIGGTDAAAVAPRYRATDLGGLHGGRSEAVAINASGEVVGSAEVPLKVNEPMPMHFTHAFLWKHGHLHDLGTMGAKGSSAIGINKRGQVLVSIEPQSPGYPDGSFLWQYGTTHRLRLDAVCINNQGHMVGRSHDGLFLIRGKHRYRIGHQPNRWGQVFGYDYVDPIAINDRDQVVFHLQSSGDEHCGVWSGGIIHEIYPGPSGGTEHIASVHAINQTGQVVGQVQAESAVMWTGSNRQKLRAPGWQETEAFGINERGSIVGSINGLDQPDERAVLWRNGTMYNLNSCISSRSGWVLIRAVGINNRGQVVGNGFHNGKRRAFLLTPVAS